MEDARLNLSTQTIPDIPALENKPKNIVLTEGRRIYAPLNYLSQDVRNILELVELSFQLLSCRVCGSSLRLVFGSLHHLIAPLIAFPRILVGFRSGLFIQIFKGPYLIALSKKATLPKRRQVKRLPILSG